MYCNCLYPDGLYSLLDFVNNLTSQALLAGVPDVFSRGFPVFAPHTDWPVSYELK